MADEIEKRGNILKGLITSNESDFKHYISDLRTLGHYDFVGEDTALSVADIYNREVHVYRSSQQPSIFRPTSGQTLHDAVLLAFYEPAHFMALFKIPNIYSCQSLNSNSPPSNIIH